MARSTDRLRWCGALTALASLAVGQASVTPRPGASPRLPGPLALEISLGAPLDAVADQAPDDVRLTHALAGFRADAFDGREWARIAKDAGAVELSLLAKGRDGFALYRSGVTDFDVLNTAHERDMLRDLMRACSEEQLALGVSYSLADAHHGNRADYLTFAASQLRELTTGYGALGSVSLLGEQIPATTIERLLGELSPEIARLVRDSSAAEGAVRVAAAKTATPAVETACHWSLMATPADLSATITALFRARARAGRLRLCVAATASGSLPAGTVTALSRLGGWVREHQSVLAAAPRDDLGVPALGEPGHVFLLVSAPLELRLAKQATLTARWLRGPDVPLAEDGQATVLRVAPSATLPQVLELLGPARRAGN